jgi:hypothetical protein
VLATVTVVSVVNNNGITDNTLRHLVPCCRLSLRHSALTRRPRPRAVCVSLGAPCPHTSHRLTRHPRPCAPSHSAPPPGPCAVSLGTPSLPLDLSVSQSQHQASSQATSLQHRAGPPWLLLLLDQIPNVSLLLLENLIVCLLLVLTATVITFLNVRVLYFTVSLFRASVGNRPPRAVQPNCPGTVIL